jgi:hypothetical protein
VYRDFRSSGNAWLALVFHPIRPSFMPGIRIALDLKPDWLNFGLSLKIG